MSYTTNIPQATDNPSTVSRIQFLNNFNAIATVMGINHVDFNDANQGKHKFLQMPVQGGSPSTSATEGSVYTQTTGGKNNLFYREGSSSTNYQLTNAFTAAGTGNIIIPGGLTLKWGTGSIGAGSTSTTIATGFTSLYTALITSIGVVNRNFATDYSSSPDLKILMSATLPTAASISWLAIGM